MHATNKMLLASAIALAAAGVTGTASARTVIYATTEPPALRAETVPAPRPGYVWVAGDWGWSGHKYRWNKGHWARERHGYHYTPARWERDGNRWRHYDGRWEH
jgi:hypothetical protein